MKQYTKDDVLKGGPGLDGYAFQAAIYCVDCTEDIVSELTQDSFDELEFQASEKVPQPIFFGESDTAQHCDSCGEYLYGRVFRCDQCEALMIQGIFCHETGCHNANSRYDRDEGRWIPQRKCFSCGYRVDYDDPCCSAEED